MVNTCNTSKIFPLTVPSKDVASFKLGLFDFSLWSMTLHNGVWHIAVALGTYQTLCTESNSAHVYTQTHARVFDHMCFATTRMDPRNETHDDSVIHSWFIFNLHTKSLICIYTAYRNLIFTQYTSNLYWTPCKNNKVPLLTSSFLILVLGRGDEFLSTLVPSLVTTAPPFRLYPFLPFPTPQPTLHC